MLIREALIDDIPQIQRVRNSVHENKLSSPDKVTDDDCALYLTKRGKGWVAEITGNVVGFAIADLLDNNIWALFLDPLFENKGIGRQLHHTMMDWYFHEGKEFAWLTTAPKTRAEKFYNNNGWSEISRDREIRFEITAQEWLDYKLSLQG